MDMVESHSDYMHLPGYDDRLTLWTLKCREWLAQRGESAALIEEQSLVRLGVASLSTDYPKGPGKGYAVKLMTAFAADSLKDTLDPVLQPCAALAWSVTKFQSVLDDADMWLSETQAAQALEAGTLYCQMYMHLAATALAMARPRYYVRPKMHSFACETLGRLRGGSKLNPRFLSCWGDEDYVGKICHRAKGSLHPTSLSKRLLQRSLLFLNSWLASLS